MRLSHFFIDRPAFAAVVAILITLIGAIAYPALPVAQYPQIAPPTVTVSTSFPGATAEVLADTVAAPIETQINGVENMEYMSSNATGDGKLTITVTFKLGTDPNNAQVLVQNRVAVAEPLLPDPVRAAGVVVRKASPDILMAVHMYSPDGSLDQQYISNYVGLHLTQTPQRLFKIDARKETGWEFCWIYRCESEGPFVLHPDEIETGAWFAADAVTQWVNEKPQDFASCFVLLWKKFIATETKSAQRK